VGRRSTPWEKATDRDLLFEAREESLLGLGETLATSLVGLARRLVAKISAYTPTLFGSTDAWGDRKGESKLCAHKPNNTHLAGIPASNAPEHGLRQFTLGSEPNSLGNPGLAPPIGVVCPLLFGQVELPVDEGRPFL
jgi:hypothetical protein